MIGETFAELVLEGKWTYRYGLYRIFYIYDYDQAVYHLDAYIRTFILAERKDLIAERETSLQIMSIALKDRAEFYRKKMLAATTEAEKYNAYMNMKKALDKSEIVLAGSITI